MVIKTTKILAIVLLASFGTAACMGDGQSTLEDETNVTSSKKKKTTDDDDAPVGKKTQATVPPKPETVANNNNANNNNASTAPQLSLLTPQTANTGATSLQVTVAGSGFASNATVKFAGQVIPSQLVSANSMTATLSQAQLAQMGSFPVVVSIGGVDSNPINFSVVNVITPTRISTISPSSIGQFAAATTLTVTGSGFVQGAKVLFNGNELSTTFSSASLLTATIPQSSLSTAGGFSVAVSSNGQLSTPLTFTVTARTPPTFLNTNITGLFAGASAQDVLVRGTGFDATTRVAVYSTSVPGGAALTPTNVTATVATVNIPATHFSVAGTVTVKVYNLLPNGQGLYAATSGTITVTP